MSQAQNSDQRQQDAYEAMRAEARRLFRVRVLYVLHIVLFIGAMVLTRGRLMRVLPLLELWALVLLAHTVVLALFEVRAGAVRTTYEREYGSPDEARDRLDKAKQDDRAQAEAVNEDEGYFTVGDDGELIPLDEVEDGQDDEALHDASRGRSQR